MHCLSQDAYMYRKAKTVSRLVHQLTKLPIYCLGKTVNISTINSTKKIQMCAIKSNLLDK